ncbi:MAG TPA: aromatic ring-hydroxylating dioxygenase subunit alpha [Candidatus Lambdaproteobacteria bacterium]|nr:aromatic ring-hydroxylating dioxygenase subunit alpha [Candidatus Lambdaproteobacteria bacterium]
MVAQMKSLREQLANCQLPAEQAFSIPPECYTSEELLQEELEKVFHHNWIGLGRADRFAVSGDYETMNLGGKPVIVLRDHDGILRAFANTCRHRGARLLNDDGNCKHIRCPFHAWTYKLDGSLSGAPHMNKVSGFERSDYGLISYHAEERLGFAFVCLAPSAPDLDDYLGDFAEIHAPWPIESLVTTRRRSLTVDCNWKAFLDVFNEYYHLPFVHPDSLDEIYNFPTPADKVTGAFASQFGNTEGTGGLLQDSEEQPLPSMTNLQGRAASGVQYTWVFPNMTFAAGMDVLWIYEAYPLGADCCQVYQSICVPPETAALPDFEKKIAAYYQRFDAGIEEDIPALVNQQRGLASSDARQGRFQPHLEANVASFARWYADQWLRQS